MAHVVFNFQMDSLLIQHKSFKKSLKALKLLNLDCPERRMVNEIEEEADEIEERIYSLNDSLFDDNGSTFKAYSNSEEVYIERRFKAIHHDLSVLSNKVNDLLVRKRI